MQVWLVSFLLLFGAVELFQWIAGLSLPLPFFAAAGVLLAIASNADKPAGLPWKTPSPTLPQKPPAAQPSPPPAKAVEAIAPPPVSHVPEQSISFTIRKPSQPGC